MSELPESISAIHTSDLPARLDRLPWAGFHRRVILALGITWVLDGLEVTLAGSLSGALMASPSLHLTAAEIGASASLYLAGAVIGALGFGWLTDRLGRKRLFSVTLGLYLAATALTALSVNFWSFALFRALTGAGIGGEYTAINAAIQELMPARLRGRIDLLVNGGFWLGAALGAVAAVTLLVPGFLPPDLGWRLAFGLGSGLGLSILWLRRRIPESPRWLLSHGRFAEAEAVMADIEADITREAKGVGLPPVTGAGLLIRPHRPPVGMIALARTLFVTYPERAMLALVLMAAQAFCYNAIFFTYALVLAKFYQVSADRIGLYILPFALSNFLGPLLLGPLFDRYGRRVMITASFGAAGLLLFASSGLFVAAVLNGTGQTLIWLAVFFVASAAASSAYLSVGEYFPLEIRALALALFYALGTGLGGVIGPVLFSRLIATGDRWVLGLGYDAGAVLLLVAAALAWRYAVAAEGQSLEQIARPFASPPPE